MPSVASAAPHPPTPPFTPTATERFYSYNRYLQNTFGGKTYKVVVASGLTCPTRDGAISKGGCTFCDVRGSSSYNGKKGRGSEVIEQIRSRIDPIRQRFNASHFLAYFQSYTNTYGEVPYLRSIYEAALSVPEIDGLCVGTRPDCLPDDVIDLLAELSERTYVSLELGVQSFENPTLEWFVRGHDGQSSIDAIRKMRARAPKVHLCAHFIFGAPTDSVRAARDAALILNDLGVEGAKLHQLMVLEHTTMGRQYREQPFKTLSLGEYGEVVRDFVDHLSPEIYIERLCANATHPEECLAPDWSRERWTPHNRLRDLLNERGCLQGRALGTPSARGAAISPNAKSPTSHPESIPENFAFGEIQKMDENTPTDQPR